MKKVLLLPDTPGWAYDIIAQNIAKNFKRYKPTIKYVRDVLLKKEIVDYRDYDVVFAFFWYDMHSMEEKYYKNFDFKKTVVGIHGLNSWEKRKLSVSEVSNIINKYAGAGCISKELCRIFKNNKVVYTPSGYDPNVFTYSVMPNYSGKINAMWAGDLSSHHHGKIKGFDDFIKPATDSNKKINLLLATKDKKIPYSKMPEFYRSGHFYICMSKTEGTPLPILESMACGRPVITTKVGIAPEIIKNGINGYIINRNLTDLKQHINKICKDDLSKMGLEARKAVSNRTWKHSAESYEKLFDLVKA